MKQMATDQAATKLLRTSVKPTTRCADATAREGSHQPNRAFRSTRHACNLRGQTLWS